MHLHIPGDIRAEVVNNYLADKRKDCLFLGNHKRNAYEDILSVCQDDGIVKLELSRQGLYDILPEALFHPVDRFDNIPANEYKERFAEEVEQQRIEESNARSFFSIFDKTLFDLSSIAYSLREREYRGNNILADIICDCLPEEYRANRFVIHTLEFVPRCRSIRGNATLISLMLRKVLAEEGIRLVPNIKRTTFEDSSPRYNYRLQADSDNPGFYLGNCYDEEELYYEIQYWNEDVCNETFLEFIDEIKVYEKFINDFFMGLETAIRFNISTITLPVRLSDELYFNYLNFNTNI